MDPLFDYLGIGTENADGALRMGMQVCAGFAAGCFIVSVLANNYSQVDKLWSITPWVYVWIFAFYDNRPDGRLLLMAFVTTLWGARLTLNFNRRGGYRWPIWEGEEDYRWEHVRKMLKSDEYPALWQLFNLTFICIYQHVLLFATALPAYIARKHQGKILTEVDFLLAGLIMLLVFLEGQADNEQFAFQTKKYELKKARRRLTGEYKDGFIQHGLWYFCRHPNYACEQSIWITLNIYAQYLENDFFVWTGIGALLLIALFYPSSLFSESITAAKYPKYVEYQRTTCRFLPFGQLFASSAQ